MTKILKCGDVIPGCHHEIRADSDAEILRRVAEHARSAYRLEVTPRLIQKARDAIHVEG